MSKYKKGKRVRAIGKPDGLAEGQEIKDHEGVIESVSGDDVRGKEDFCLMLTY